MAKSFIIAAVLAISLGMTAPVEAHDRTSGTLVGVGAGALSGGAIGGPVGALVGAVIGGVTGAHVGEKYERRNYRYDRRDCYETRSGRLVCR